MKCPVCGRDNEERYVFCTGCGTKLQPEDQMGEEDLFENEETVVLDDEDTIEDSFENEKTVIIKDEDVFIDDFENEETMVIREGSVSEEISVPDSTPPAAPAFDYRTVYKEYRTADDETAYIDHLRKLKGLLDDGIITEDEFTRKKQQILGL